MNIKDLESNFTDLQAYSDAQFKTIVQLNQEIAKLKSENDFLKMTLDQNHPTIALPVSHLGIGISNEQLICETQILILKNDAMIRPLTMEETRKLEIFTNVLEKVKRNTLDPVQVEVNKLSDTDLLTILKNEAN